MTLVPSELNNCETYNIPNADYLTFFKDYIFIVFVCVFDLLGLSDIDMVHGTKTMREYNETQNEK